MCALRQVVTHSRARDRLYRKAPGHHENWTATRANRPHTTKIEIPITKMEKGPEGKHAKAPKAKKGPRDPGREKASGPR